MKLVIKKGITYAESKDADAKGLLIPLQQSRLEESKRRRDG